MGSTSRELYTRAFVQHELSKPQAPQEQFQTAHREGALQEQLAISGE